MHSDVWKACKLYLAGEHHLSPIGQWKVGLALKSGVGMSRDVHRAVHFFEMCANCGHEYVQRKYLTYYTKRHGVERSRLKAKSMIQEAAQRGIREQ